MWLVLLVFILFFFTEIHGAHCRYRVSFSTNGWTSYYCTTSCCGSIFSRECCSSAISPPYTVGSLAPNYFIAVVVVSVLIVVGFIATLVCVLIKKNGVPGRVIRPQPQTMVVTHTSGSPPPYSLAHAPHPAYPSLAYPPAGPLAPPSYKSTSGQPETPPAYHAQPTPLLAYPPSPESQGPPPGYHPPPPGLQGPPPTHQPPPGQGPPSFYQHLADASLGTVSTLT
ncbi:protein shisa-5-like [Haliotis rubra]|uniref:protein shisa-5-like n=1 Tax=Haliotis rubra TaxID=36100 RepID=UPI001EE58E32|nr:protein shisa-5-like [Haliotis rubra]